MCFSEQAVHFLPNLSKLGGFARGFGMCILHHCVCARKFAALFVSGIRYFDEFLVIWCGGSIIFCLDSPKNALLMPQLENNRGVIEHS